MATVITVPDHCITWDSAAGDPFLIYFASISDAVEQWCKTNLSGEYEIVGGDETLYDCDAAQQMTFTEAKDAWRFIVKWFSDSDLLYIGDLLDRTEDMDMPMENEWGCCLTPRTIIVWGPYG